MLCLITYVLFCTTKYTGYGCGPAIITLLSDPKPSSDVCLYVTKTWLQGGLKLGRVSASRLESFAPRNSHNAGAANLDPYPCLTALYDVRVTGRPRLTRRNILIPREWVTMAGVM